MRVQTWRVGDTAGSWRIEERSQHFKYFIKTVKDTQFKKMLHTYTIQLLQTFNTHTQRYLHAIYLDTILMHFFLLPQDISTTTATINYAVCEYVSRWLL